MWIKTKEELMEEQKTWCEEDEYKHFDFSASDLWRVTDDGYCEAWEVEDA